MTAAGKRLRAELRRRRGELVDLCTSLVRIPSENPPGDTTRIAAFAARYLRERGFRPVVHEPRRGMPNVVASLGAGAPNLVLSGHLDEFPAGEGWTFPPFEGTVRGGRIRGRGAGDMRAGLAVALFAMGLVREAGLTPRGTLTLAFASDEETGGIWGTQWLLEHVRAVRGDACLIGESSGTWSVGIGEKGVLWVRIRAEGVSGHAAYGLGESAVTKVLAVVRAAERLRGRSGRPRPEVARAMRRQRGAAERRWGPGTGRIAERLTVNVGGIRGGGQVNLIPARAEADLDFRLPPGLPTAAVLRALRRSAAAQRGVAIEVLNRCESYVTAPGERLVRLVVDNARALRGSASLPVVRPGYTDGRFFRRAGIPTVVYGPQVRGMGGPDESIDARELVDVAAVHLGVVADYLGLGAS
jgi:succinyl-diaminopimelate desuccinylase